MAVTKDGSRRIGAGDSTVAGLVLGLARGLPLVDAARYGVAAGAAAVMPPGTQLCRKQDVDRLFSQVEWDKLSRGIA